jgi:hypothetical protein
MIDIIISPRWGMNDDEYYAALYRRKFPHKDKLDGLRGIIKWDLFRPILNGLFEDTEVGRPHKDVMTEMLVLQPWYSLSMNSYNMY